MKKLNDRSSHQRYSVKNGVLKNFTGKHLYRTETASDKQCSNACVIFLIGKSIVSRYESEASSPGNQ